MRRFLGGTTSDSKLCTFRVVIKGSNGSRLPLPKSSKLNLTFRQSHSNFIMAPRTDGEFRRKTSQFRSTIPSAEFPAEADRYVLYMNNLCPWVHRTLIVRALKGLEDLVKTIEVDSYAPGKGWIFSGKYGPEKDPITGLKTMREVYERHHPGSLENGIASVPVLFDKKTSQFL
jgi:glutathionyl-hydroquinone reductase